MSNYPKDKVNEFGEPIIDEDKIIEETEEELLSLDEEELEEKDTI